MKSFPIYACFFSLLEVTVYGLSSGGAQGPWLISKRSSPQFSEGDAMDFINENVDPEQIKANLNFLSAKPHMAGTVAEQMTAQWVHDTWQQQGLDEVHLTPYRVLLSYPDTDKPNLVQLKDLAGEVVWESQAKQPPLYAPEEANTDIPFNFNAYSAPGTVQGSLVYVNYGREEDLDYLEGNGITLEGKIILARYGKTFRANTANMAESRGAAGVIFYTDPADYAVMGTESVYPDTVMMPPTGVQLGTVKLTDGDPLTPFYPSIESAFHIPEEEAAIPKIPVQPVSYGDAFFLLNSLDGPVAPVDWQGGLNITYHLGPTHEAYKVQLDVHTSNQHTSIQNVIGMIRGEIEPDRYVLLGNHRDAWIFGAIDPSSGTAAMLEVSRVLMQLHNTGWRPRRSIVFCSWGAEEYGLVGSMEWVEQFGVQLRERAVAYLNIDLALQGNYSFVSSSVPLLYDIIWDISKKVDNPDQEEVAAGRNTVYDTWVHRTPDPDKETQPMMELLGSGSDYRGFIHNVGVPSLDIRYAHDGSITGWYPLYHSLYETFSLVDELYDEGFLFHSAVTKIWAGITTSLADEAILPYSLNEYADFITSAQLKIVEDFGPFITENDRSLDYFLEAGTLFSSSVIAFDASLASVDLSDPLEVRRINDCQMNVERAFIDTRGLPGRPDYYHVVFAPSESNAYSGTAFSGLTDVLSALQENPTEQTGLWRQFDEHLAAVTHLLSTAASVLSLKLW